MPISRYDPLWGGKGGAQKALDAMVKEYGPSKGRSVFYAATNKKKRKRKGNALSDALKRS